MLGLHPKAPEGGVSRQRRLRVLHCLWDGELGGAERAVYQLVREQLKDPSLEPALLFAQGRGLYWERANALGCGVFALGITNGRAVRAVTTAPDLMRGFDIHHFHSAEPLLMLASARCRGACRVYTHRGGMMRYALRKRLQYEAAGLITRHSFHGFSGNTAHAARSGARLFRLPASSFKTTYNGLDFDLLAVGRTRAAVREAVGFAADDFVLGTSANLREWKRIDRLIDAVAAVHDARMRLLVIGDGPDHARLENHAQQLGVSSNVVFAGRQEHPWDYVQAMDAFSLPSTAMESFGNAAVEAMALGVPTLVFADGGGLVEHVDNDVTGFVVSNQRELEATLMRLIADPELGKRVGARGAAIIRARYTPPQSAAVYREFYRHALQSAQRSSAESPGLLEPDSPRVG